MAVGRLRETLVDTFGDRSVFRDKEDIASAEDWQNRIDDALQYGAVVLALIGHRWTACLRRRAGDAVRWSENNEVRRELVCALEREVPVIPVLVDEAPLPGARALPPELKGLLRRNAVPLRDSHWNAEVARLVSVLSGFGFKLAGREQPLARPKDSIEAWFAAIDRYGYESAWTIASQDTRDNYDKETFVSVFEQQHQPLRGPKLRTTYGVQALEQLPDGKKGRFQIHTFETMFESGKRMYEQVVLGLEQGEWKVFNYNLIPGRVAN
jgi:hypothetical protein